MKREKYGKIPIQQNWNRMAELTEHWPKKGSVKHAELEYRLFVQNYFSATGKLPKGYIPVGRTP